MKVSKAQRRDKKRNKKKNGMIVSGKSVFLIQSIQIKKANKIKRVSS